MLPQEERWLRVTINNKLVKADGMYSITQDGVVYSYLNDNKSVMFQQPNRGGYLRTSIYLTDKRYEVRIHRAVMETWGKPDPDPMRDEVNHIDGVKTNNHISNLEWASRAEQQQHAIKLGLIKTAGEDNNGAIVTERDVRMIRWLYSVGEPQSYIEDIFGLAPKSAHPIVHNQSWQMVKTAATPQEIDEACQRISVYHQTLRGAPPSIEVGDEGSVIEHLTVRYGLRDKLFGRALRRYAKKHHKGLKYAISKIKRMPGPDLWRVVPPTDPHYVHDRTPMTEPIRQYEVWELMSGYTHAGKLTKWLRLWHKMEQVSGVDVQLRAFDVDIGAEVIVDLAEIAAHSRGVSKFSSARKLIERLE